MSGRQHSTLLMNIMSTGSCRLVNDVLRDFLHQFEFVYLDDILIFSKSMAEHIQHVHQVLQRLLTLHLLEKPEKCEFHISQISFLGYVHRISGLCTDGLPKGRAGGQLAAAQHSQASTAF